MAKKKVVLNGVDLTMAEHEEDYYAALVKHLGKHVRILTAETDI